jgi:hypothetical protein
LRRHLVRIARPISFPTNSYMSMCICLLEEERGMNLSWFNPTFIRPVEDTKGDTVNNSNDREEEEEKGDTDDWDKE